MSKSNVFPKIILNGKTYTATKPKAKIWREMVKFNSKFENPDILNNEGALDPIFCLISEAFNNPEVTPQSVEEGIDLDELMPKFTEVCEWIAQIVSGKSVELPNSQTPARK